MRSNEIKSKKKKKKEKKIAFDGRKKFKDESPQTYPWLAGDI